LLSLQYKNRIGAWTTGRPLHRLVESLHTKNQLITIIDVIELVRLKGCVLKIETIDKAFELCVRANNADCYKRIEKISRSLCDSATLESFAKKYPSPVVVTTEAPLESPVVATTEASSKENGTSIK
jgi:hypothetical protein